MKFKEFYENNILLEALNIGDSMEGVFCIVVALQMAYGYVTKEMVQEARRDADISGTKEVIIDTNVKDNPAFDNIVSDPNDILQVRVKLNLRQANVKGMFGPNLTSHPVIDSHIQTLIDKVGNISAIDKIQRFMISVLTNKKPDEVIFYVVADGVGGSTSGGKIKGDITIKIEAKTKTDIPNDLEVPISFSLKVDSDLVSNLGIFSGILKLGQLFELEMIKGLETLDLFPNQNAKMRELLYDHQDQWDNDSHIIYYLRQYMVVQDKFMAVPDEEYEGGVAQRKLQQAQSEIEQLKLLIERFLDEFESQIESEDYEQFTTDPRARLFTSRVLRFLEKELFGEDLADIIRISKGDIQELNQANLDELKNDHVINFKKDGSTMKFFTVDINNEQKLLFQIRPRVEYNQKKNIKTQQFSVELGDL